MKFEFIIRKGIEVGLIIFAIGSPFSITLAQSGLIIALFFWLLNFIFIDRKLKGTFIDIPLIIFLSGLLISSILSIAPLKSLKANKIYWLISIIYLIVNNVDLDFAKKLLIILMVSATISGLYGIFQSVTGIDIWRGTVRRYNNYFCIAWGGFGLKLTYGGYQMMIALILLAISIYGIKKYQLLSIISSVIVILSLIASFCRSAWGGFIAGLTVLTSLFFIAKKGLIILLGIFLLTATLFLFTPTVIRDRFFSTFNDIRYSSRVIIWNEAIRIIKENPIFGIGSSMFETYAQEYKTHTHNDFLNVYLSGGIIGFIGYILIFFIYFRKMISLYIKLNKTSQMFSSIIIGFVTSVFGFLVAGLGQCFFTDSENVMLLWFVFGISFVIYQNVSSIEVKNTTHVTEYL